MVRTANTKVRIANNKDKIIIRHNFRLEHRKVIYKILIVFRRPTEQGTQHCVYESDPVQIRAVKEDNSQIHLHLNSLLQTTARPPP